jgi:serine/threonine-protein kinase
VTVVVSTGPAPVADDSEVGLREANAVSALQGQGFKVKVADRDTDDPGQDGRVVAQSPEGNTPAEPGSTVTITVGRYVEPETTVTAGGSPGGTG